jgi:hypothetical protein
VKAGEPIIVSGQAGLPDGASITVEKPAEKDAATEKPTVEKSNDKKSPPASEKK